MAPRVLLTVLLCCAFLAACRPPLQPPAVQCAEGATRCTGNGVEVCGEQGRWREGPRCGEVTPYTLNWTCCLSNEHEWTCAPRAECVQMPPDVDGGAADYQLLRR